MNIGEMIAGIRKYKGMTQKELGELCGMNEANVRKYELNLAVPKLDTLNRIAGALGVPYYFILDDEGIGEAFLKGEFTLDEYYKNLTAGTAIEKINSRNGRRLRRQNDSACQGEQSTADESLLVSSFQKLNNTGKQEAVKRVEELTQIPKYTCEESAPISFQDSGLRAAHNDNTDPDQLEKMRQDLEWLKNQ